MPHRNWVTPYGEIVVSSGRRGEWMGNRGCLHRGDDLMRPWNGKRWITCVLEFRGWVAPKWAPGRWTALFFETEAVALAAGHRPCALCRHTDYLEYCAALGMKGADAVDARLHNDRLDGRCKRLHTMPWRAVPAGAFVDVAGVPMLVQDDDLRPWSPDAGFGKRLERPIRGHATVITPAANVAALRGGYRSR